MEIKNVVNKVKNEYPKMNQISKKHLINNIPNKWIKIGLSSLVISIILKNNVFAINNTNHINSSLIAGGLAVYQPPTYIKICDTTCSIVEMISIVTFIITGLKLLMANKKLKEYKSKKLMKIIFIISILLFILSFLGSLFIKKYIEIHSFL